MALRHHMAPRPSHRPTTVRQVAGDNRRRFHGFFLAMLGLVVVVWVLVWSCNNGSNYDAGHYQLAQSNPHARQFVISAQLDDKLVLKISTKPRRGKDSKGDASLCHMAPLNVQDRRINRSRLRVVNFNVEWLFQFGGSGSIKCPGKFCPWTTISEATRHLEDVAAVITRLDADIVNLNEVEGCRTLEFLISMLPVGHGYRAFLLRGTDSATGQNPALLTRIDPTVDLWRSKARVGFPIVESICNTDESGTMGISKHYITSFKISNEMGDSLGFVLASAHFLAMPLDRRRCARREAQATVLEEAIRKFRRKDEELMIVGDFNDFDNEALGADGRHSISRTIEILHHIDKQMPLKNAAKAIPQSKRYSNWFDINRNCMDNGGREHTYVDHILLSDGLYRRLERAWFYHDYKVSCEKRVSDHWPLVVDFRL